MYTDKNTLSSLQRDRRSATDYSMVHGYYTIEEWRGKEQQWVAVCTLNGDQSLSDALQALERHGKAGFFRVVQMQSMIWAEKDGDKLRLREWQADSPEDLSRTAEEFDRDGGKWPADGPVDGA